MPGASLGKQTKNTHKHTRTRARQRETGGACAGGAGRLGVFGESHLNDDIESLFFFWGGQGVEFFVVFGGRAEKINQIGFLGGGGTIGREI